MNRSVFIKVCTAGLASAAVPVNAAGLPDAVLGILTDCQYADIPTPPKVQRFYRDSPRRLKEAITHLNSMKDVGAMFHLGDAIDQKEGSYDVVMPIFKTASVPVHHIAGNHDYSVADTNKSKVGQYLGLKNLHYSLKMNGWKIIMLDGNELSLFSTPAKSPGWQKATRYKAAAKRKLADHTGGIGPEQLTWLKSELAAAHRAKERVIIMCHYPLLPLDGHALWNAEEVLAAIDAVPGTVAAWFNGHNHAGSYQLNKGVHYLNFRGMVETPQNAYARVELRQDRLEVTGFGREPSRVLRLRPHA